MQYNETFWGVTILMKLCGVLSFDPKNFCGKPPSSPFIEMGQPKQNSFQGQEK